MATAGLFDPLRDPISASLQCGLDMIEASRLMEPNWEVRVGIHFGPVVAGIIGKRHFGFDLWGDTVNMAARIAAQAGPSTVVTSGATWHRVRDRARGRSLGLVCAGGQAQRGLSFDTLGDRPIRSFALGTCTSSSASNAPPLGEHFRVDGRKAILSV